MNGPIGRKHPPSGVRKGVWVHPHALPLAESAVTPLQIVRKNDATLEGKEECTCLVSVSSMSMRHCSIYERWIRSSCASSVMPVYARPGLRRCCKTRLLRRLPAPTEILADLGRQRLTWWPRAAA